MKGYTKQFRAPKPCQAANIAVYAGTESTKAGDAGYSMLLRSVGGRMDKMEAGGESAVELCRRAMWRTPLIDCGNVQAVASMYV